jgi:hypothetical protein
VLGGGMLVVWVFGVPLVGFFLLFKNRKKLDDDKVRGMYLILYQGVKPKAFYWEFVNTIRKVLILSINILISEESPLFKAFLGTFILISVLRLHHRIQPYKKQLINDLEAKEIVTSTITLYGAIIFV